MKTEADIERVVATLLESEPEFKRWQASSGAPVFDAELGPCVVGGVLLDPEGDRRYAAIQTMRVPEDEGWRNNGLGTKLLKAALVDLLSQGATDLRCTVHSRPALKIFEKVLGDGAVRWYVPHQDWRQVAEPLTREDAFARLGDLPSGSTVRILADLTEWSAKRF